MHQLMQRLGPPLFKKKYHKHIERLTTIELLPIFFKKIVKT
jgi:hypothetical protein